MNHKGQTNNYTEFYYHAFRNILLVSVPLVIIFALVLSIPHSSATVSGASADSLTLSLPTSCTLSSVVNSAHNATLISGTYTSDIGKTTITTLCNDGNGYAIYANGLSNGTVGNNALMSSVSSNHNIATGIYEQGDTTSSWAMKLGNVSGDTSPTPPVIEQGYNNTYGLVPSTWTKVAGRQSGTTDMINGSTFTTTYAVYTAPTQHAGTYTGQVGYVLVHAYNDDLLPNEPYFMQNVSEWQNEIPNPGDTLQTMDTRDGKQYWVTRLADGHIWMTQNLDLDIGGATPLNSDNTDISTNPNTYVDGSIYSDYSVSDGVYTWNPSATAITFDKVINYNDSKVSNWANDNNAPYSAEGGDTYFYTSNSATSDTRYNSLSDCVSASHTELDCTHYHVGNYYNWTAAIASNNSSNLTTQYINATNSICPKGWRLPIATNNNQSVYEFGNLLYLYEITQTKIGDPVMFTTEGPKNIRKTPLWFVQGGYIYQSNKQQIFAFGFYGNYWSNVVDNSRNAYNLGFGTQANVNARPAFATDRPAGRSVRCVAR